MIKIQIRFSETRKILERYRATDFVSKSIIGGITGISCNLVRSLLFLNKSDAHGLYHRHNSLVAAPC